MDEHFLKKRFEDLERQAISGGVYRFTGFLSPGDAALCFDVSNGKYIKTWGGAKECERVMVRFGDADELGYECDFPIAIIRIRALNSKYAEPLTHRDFLGSLMSLGIERDTIGDIMIDKHKSTAYVFVNERIAGFVTENIDRIKNTTVMCERVKEIPEGLEPELKELRLIVATPRIDAIIARLYNLSRSASRVLFTSGMVLVNGKNCGNESLVLSVGDVVAVRGHGKFVYDGESKKTAKGNVSVTVRKYV